METLHWTLGSASSSLCDCHSRVGEGVYFPVVAVEALKSVCEKALLLLSLCSVVRRRVLKQERLICSQRMYAPPKQASGVLLRSSPRGIPFSAVFVPDLV